jgi:hypothetical protein
MSSTRWPPGDRVKARGTPPVLPARVDLEAGVAQPLDGAGVVVGDDRDVALPRGHRVIGEEQVHLRAGPLGPGAALAQLAGRVDGLEAQQRPEPQLGLDVAETGLEGDVLDHGRSRRTCSTFLACICRWAAVRRASGSGASSPGSACR